MISVIVPIYNVAPYLKKCVDSVLAQTYKDFELLLVDDGSKDESAAICDNYKDADSRIRVIHKENGGLTSARIAGRNAAKGKYILFVDGDDYVEVNMLQELIETAEEKQADITICNYFLAKEDGTKQPISLPISDLNDQESIFENYTLAVIGDVPGKVNLPGFSWIRLYLKSILTDNAFVSEREYFSEDDILNLEVSQNAHKIAAVNLPLYNYVQHSTSLTYKYRSNMWDMIQNRYLYFKKFLEEKKCSDDQFQRLYFNGLTGLMNSIDNIVKGCSYKEAKNKFTQIHNSELFLEVQNKIDRSLISETANIWFSAFEKKCWYFLYYYRKFRLFSWRP